jgi:hypothetical protein
MPHWGVRPSSIRPMLPYPPATYIAGAVAAGLVVAVGALPLIARVAVALLFIAVVSGAGVLVPAPPVVHNRRSTGDRCPLRRYC